MKSWHKSSLNDNWRFVSLIIAFGALASLLWILIIPYNGANDEYLHYGVARFIADENRLPVYNKDDYMKSWCEEIRTSQMHKMITTSVCQSSYSIFPMPSYVISALFIKFIDTDVPYRYIFARLPNILYFITFLLLTWATLKKVFVFENTRKIAFISIVLIPQIIFINAYVNSDGFSLMIGTFVVYMWFKIFNEGLMWKNIILGSIALGFLASTKYNYFILFPGTAIFILSSSKQLGWKKIITFSFAALLGVAILSGWWYARNYFLYGDALGFSTVKKTFEILAPNQSALADLGYNSFATLFGTNWSEWSFKSFFAVFGWTSITLPNIFYGAIFLFVALSFFGWLFHCVEIKNISKKILFKKSPLYLAFFFTITASIWLSLWTSVYNDFQPQGRYLFPAVIPIMIVIIKGIQRFNKMINGGEKILIGLFAGLMTILWIFSYLMLAFYYEILRSDLIIQSVFFYYEKMVFALQNGSLRILILTTGSIILAYLIFKIWRNILRDINTS